MAYTPKTWQCGEPIMADDLNHMEQGIAQGGSVLMVNVVNTDPALNSAKSEAPLLKVSNDHWLDKTWQQIHDAFPNVCLNLAGTTIGTEGKSSFPYVYSDHNGYHVITAFGSTTFDTASADGYPKATLS